MQRRGKKSISKLQALVPKTIILNDPPVDACLYEASAGGFLKKKVRMMHMLQTNMINRKKNINQGGKVF